MKKIIENKYITLIAQVLLGIVFLLSGLEKIADPAAFSDSVANYRVLPDFAVNITALTLPFVELTTGLLLLIGIRMRENAAVIGALLIVFEVLILSAIFRNLDIECGCFGTLDAQKVGLRKILENIGLILLSVQIIFFSKKNFSLIDTNDR